MSALRTSLHYSPASQIPPKGADYFLEVGGRVSSLTSQAAA